MNNFDNRSLSFSTLKYLQEGPSLFRAMLNKKFESEGLTIGSIVDVLLTDPERFATDFLLKKGVAPTGMMEKYIYYLINVCVSRGDSTLTDEDFDKAYNYSAFKISKDTIKERFEKEFSDYHKEIVEQKKGKKTLYTQEDYDVAIRVVDSLNSNPHISQCFRKEGNQDVFQQLKIEWVYKGLKLKSILDLVKIDYDKKLVVIYDIKTTGYSVNSFKDSIEKYQYWLQMVMYGMAIYSYFKKDVPDIETYEVKFKWIVESTKYPGSPCIYTMSKKDEEAGLNGGKIGNKYYKGFIELIDDYLWYVENNEWNTRKDIATNNFEVDISIFN